MRETLSDAWLVAVEEFRRNVRRTGYRITTLSLPVLLILAMVAVPIIQSVADDDDTDPPRHGFVDQGDVLVEGVEQGTAFVQYPDEANARQALLDDEIESLFVIPPDYMESGRVRLLRTDSGLASNPGVEAQFRSLVTVGLIADDLEPELLQRVLVPPVFDRARVTETGDEQELDRDAVRLLAAGAFAVAIFIAISFGAGYLLQAVAEEKENRMIEVLATSISPLGIMTGKVAGITGLLFLQIGVWFASILLIGPRIFGQFDQLTELDFGLDLYVLLVAFLIATHFFSAGISATVGAVTTSVREASQFGGMLVLPFVVPFWALGPLIENPEGTLARVLSLIPFTAPLTMIIRVAVSDPSPFEVLLSLGIVAASAALMLWVAARLFRVGMLLYGQRMSLRAIGSALRSSS